MLKVIKLKINGREQKVAVDDKGSLLDTFRRLGFTSVKEGCGAGEYGACTVLVNGETTDSCIYLSIWVDDRSIMTMEDLRGPNGELSPIQKVFIEEATVQCGFCTPGPATSTMEIVGIGERCNREELKRLVSGHFCHCTGYENILDATERIMEETCRVVGE